MNIYKDFIISTTPTLQGYEIKKYLGTVSTHVVAGTGLISDLFASVSDVFGGRSDSYQKQLNSLKNEVFNILIEDAKNKGANSIVGIKLDFDEISGKAKQMFMVSAVGTATLVEKIDSTGSKDISDMNRETLIGDSMELEVEKLELFTSLKKENYQIDSDDWEILTKNSLPELFDHLVNDFLEESKDEEPDNFKVRAYYQHFCNYIRALSKNDLMKNIYKLFYIENSLLIEIGFKFMKDRGLVSYEKIIAMLSNESLAVRKRSLEILYDTYKTYYNVKDINELETIKEIVKKSFPEITTTFDKKKTMSSKVLSYWECICEYSNPISNKYCYSCYRDRRGIKKEDISPEDVLEQLSYQIDVLTKNLSI